MVVAMMLTAAPLSGFVGIELPALFDFKAEAAETYSGTCGDNLTWSLDTETGVLEISGTGAMTNSKPAPWYAYRSYITSVNIADGVTTIGNFAFDGCSSLKSITIPENVTSIGSNAFYLCSNINTLNYNAINCIVGSRVFCDLVSDEYGNILGPVLTTINIGDKVELLSDSIFYGCTSVEKINLPDSLKRIGKSAFASCYSLTEINIPVNVTEIGDSAFSGCSKLATVNYDAKRATITDRTSNRGKVFNGCDSLTTVNVGTEVEAIPSDGNGGSLFDYLDTITTLNFNAKYYDASTWVYYGPFNSCDSLINITIGSEVRDIPCNILKGSAYYKDSSNWKNGVLYVDDCLIYASNISDSYSVADSTRLIAAYAFSNDRNMNLTEIVFPERLIAIGSHAFDSCASAKHFFISSNVEYIGELAFKSCGEVVEYCVDKDNEKYSTDEYGVLFNKEKTELIQYPIGNKRTEYSIPESTVLICDYAFSGMTFIKDEGKGWVVDHGGNLKKVNVADSVTVIGEGAFCWHGPLETVVFNASSKLDIVNNEAFKECRKLKNIILPQSLVSIGDYAFESCLQLPGYLHIPESVKTIGESILYDAAPYIRDGHSIVPIQIGICSTNETGYVKTYAEENEYPFMVCSGEHEYVDHEHILKSVEIPATCTTDGEKYQECEICNNIIGSVITIPATGHTSSGKYETVKSPTCTEEGTAVTKCVTCKEVLDTQIVPATGHSAGSWVTTKQPTCTAEGEKVKKCTKCSTELEKQAIATTEHIAGNWQVVTMPTATSEGVKVKKCTGCGKEMARETMPMVDIAVQILAPSTNTVNYGETLVLHSSLTELPVGTNILWTVEGNGVTIQPSEDGLTCNVTSVQTGNVTVTATVVDEEGNAILDADGNEITAAQQLNSKAGFWQKFISFFKNLFGISRMILQSK